MSLKFRDQITERKQIKDLTEWARQVWMLTDLADKKAIALDMVDNFEFKAKAAMFIQKIEKARSGGAIDKLVSDIALAGEGLAVKR